MEAAEELEEAEEPTLAAGPGDPARRNGRASSSRLQLFHSAAELTVVYFEDDEAKGRERLADAVPVLKALASWVEKPGAQALIEPLIAQLCEAVGDMKGPIDEGDAWELYSAAEAIVPEQAGQPSRAGLPRLARMELGYVERVVKGVFRLRRNEVTLDLGEPALIQINEAAAVGLLLGRRPVMVERSSAGFLLCDAGADVAVRGFAARR
jgi:hypothetical protein